MKGLYLLHNVITDCLLIESKTLIVLAIQGGNVRLYWNTGDFFKFSSDYERVLVTVSNEIVFVYRRSRVASSIFPLVMENNYNFTDVWNVLLFFFCEILLCLFKRYDMFSNFDFITAKMSRILEVYTFFDIVSS